MVAPLVVGAIAAASLYGGYRSIRGGIENRRFWNDYRARTGIRPKYPIRSGYSYDYSRAVYAGAGIAGLYSAPAYGFAKTPRRDPMYG